MANIGFLSHTFYCNFCRDIEYSSLYQEHGNIKDRYIGVPLYKEFLLGKEFSRTLLITTYCRLHYKKRKRVSWTANHFGQMYYRPVCSADQDASKNTSKYASFQLSFMPTKPEGIQRCFMRGGSAPRSNPSPFRIPFLTEKVIPFV